MATQLGKIGRVKGSSPTAGDRFPKTLSAERTIIIKIYDTSYQDPNAPLATGSSEIAKITKEAFAKTSDIDSVTALVDAGASGISSTIEGATNLWDSISAAAATVTSFGGTAISIAKTSAGHILETYSDYAKNFKDFGNTGLAGKKGNPIWMDNLYLPLPNEISESLNHSYSDTEGFAQSALPLVSAAANTVESASNLASKATGRQALLKNANKLVKYDSSDFRTISLSWTLIANNRDESLAIQNIITKLKAYSSPQAVGGKLLLRAPFYFELEFPNKIIHNALQFKECVIQNIEVNYSTSGHMETFTDNMPKTMTLSITFQDREPKTLQAWAEGQEGYESTNEKDPIKPPTTTKAVPDAVGYSASEVGAGYTPTSEDDSSSGWN